MRDLNPRGHSNPRRVEVECAHVWDYGYTHELGDHRRCVGCGETRKP